MTAIAATHHSPSAYLRMTDEQIVALAQKGDPLATECLLRKHRPMVLSSAKGYFIRGAERADIVQEGMVGLFEAIRDYRADRNTTFGTFAKLCVGRQMKTAIKRVGDKNFASIVRFEEMSTRNGFDPVERLLQPESNKADPYWVISSAETAKEFQVVIRARFSVFEFRVCCLLLDGCSYEQAALTLGCKPKSVDNARQRIRGKMGRCLAQICH